MEQHPLEPFLPKNAKILMLGSFPPSQKRWSMDFYYPNWQNDMWRIFGLVFFDEKDYFTIPSEKKFDKEKIVNFLNEKGIAFSDTAKSVTRLKGTASDQFLEVDETMDIGFFLRELPQCIAIITTGGKAAETLCKQYDAEVPAVGGHTDILFEGRKISIYRMPSSSRAYPKPIDEKAKMYASIKTILS
ncbi:MAG TPA: uracil-DNA glycosylase family protein [Paludibacteraceae bacterium]|jgi:G:T/U-mismatch repair DNA glycosylase|nr:uracil-DNA glycosylase family protein [Paludibacteraceae bacterium]HPH63138.1 uracil-DNA glycosylase family protein [Paludibacteraceae bacterium]